MNGDNEHWASISDMMSGLMIIFLFISVAYMNSVTKSKVALEAAKVQAEAARQKVESIAQTWDRVQVQLYNDLYAEFRDNLESWDAHIDRKTLSVRFREPSVFFNAGSSRLTPGFEKVLDEFFPRYIKILDRYKNHIAEVRIEGHTSSEWKGVTDSLKAYFLNMQLSQDRTRAVLHYCLEMPQVSGYLDWAMSTITANGMSSSHPVLNPDHTENPDLSRRVEFRVRIDSDSSIKEILEDTK